MKTLKKLFAVLFTAVVCCVFAQEIQKPKYVFLFIGDGMSIPQRMVAEQYSKLIRNGKGLAINSLDCQGVTTTSSADSFITDSAASGTAIACGEKTNNGRIGMDAEGSRRLVSTAEVAKAAGKKVGIVSSVTINHATPAAFYAHNVSRGNYYQIGLDLIASNFDYFGGGGVAQNNKKDDPMYKGDIYDLAAEAGYIVARNRAEFEAIKPGAGKVLASGAKNELPYTIDMKDEDIRLVEFTRQAISMLEDGPNGFFLMVEGGMIDYMCHANDAATTISEVLAMDECVEVAQEFAAKHPGETLIVVTGDHETGGLTMGFAGTGYQSFIQNLSAQTCSRDVMAIKFNGLKGKTFEDAKPLITEVSGLIFDRPNEAKLGNLILSANDVNVLKNAFDRQFKDGGNDGHSLTVAVVQMLDNKSAVAWTSGAHTALPVSTTASGVGATQFSNMLDNTNISQRMKELVK